MAKSQSKTTKTAKVKEEVKEEVKAVKEVKEETNKFIEAKKSATPPKTGSTKQDVVKDPYLDAINLLANDRTFSSAIFLILEVRNIMLATDLTEKLSTSCAALLNRALADVQNSILNVLFKA